MAAAPSDGRQSANALVERGASDAQGANLVVNETFNKNLAAAQRWARRLVSRASVSPPDSLRSQFTFW